MLRPGFKNIGPTIAFSEGNTVECLNYVSMLAKRIGIGCEVHYCTIYDVDAKSNRSTLTATKKVGGTEYKYSESYIVSPDQTHMGLGDQEHMHSEAFVRNARKAFGYKTTVKVRKITKSKKESRYTNGKHKEC